MEEKGREVLLQNTIRHLENIAASTFTTCPSIARFYLLKLKVKEDICISNQKHVSRQFDRCPFCYAPYVPSSTKMRLLPKMKLTAKVKRLLKRNDDNPGSLGKFEQKLVNDYTHSRNRLAVQCLHCHKTIKIPGQSRQDKFRQTQHPVDDEESVISDIPKTRKEKIKEKKRRGKKRKKERMGVDEDHNAGLIINGSTPITDQPAQESLHKQMAVISANQKPEENSTRTDNLPANQKHSNRSVQNQLFKDKTTFKKDQTSVQHNNVKPGVASWIMSSKKKKGKQLSQQLGDILKQEKSKAAEGSLADFLSSI